MALWYTGARPVTKGRNSNDSVHPYKGTAGEYSNWSLWNTSNVLDGAPNENHVPGEGRHPHGLQMSRWYLGLQNESPMENTEDGFNLEGLRFRPLEYKGTDGQGVFSGDWGHAKRDNPYSVHNNFTFAGIGEVALNDPGHGKRYVDAEGTANSFGTFEPHIYKGITPEPLDDPGMDPADYDEVYGRVKINEWKGVASSKALNV